jgi:L-fucose isomerase-like protein
MKQRIRLGLVCLARETYDFAAAADIYKGIKADLAKLEAVDWEVIPELVMSVEDAQKAARRFAEARLDAFVCISGTFHLGHLVLEIRKLVKLPVLLWGLDELPYNGGKIRLNSVCGVNLNASNLYKAGVDDYRATVGPKIDSDWVDAIRAIVALRDSHVGIVGYHAHGFFNLSFESPSLYGDTGALVDHYELSELHGIEVPADAVAQREAQIRSTFDVSALKPAQVSKVAELSAKIAAFCDKNRIDALAIRCWPEFARDFGVAPCAAMSLLQSEGRILACEGDVEGALSMIAHRAIGAETPYLFDFSQVNFEENFALLWHCGVAPCNLWDGCSVRSLDTYFAGGKGVTAGFVLKSGEVSIARIDSARGKRRLFLQSAKAVPMEKELAGTYLKAVFDRPVREVLDLIIRTGVAHHASMVYGDFVKPLEIAAGIMGWEIIR